MRGLVLALIVLISLVAAGAQEQVELKLSQSSIAIRVVDPIKQLEALSPVIDMFSELAQLGGPAGKQLDLPSLRERIVGFINSPGVNTKGEFWFVVLPPAPVAAANGAPAAAVKPVTLLLVPLADAQAFNNFLQTQQGKVTGTVCGTYGILTDDKTALKSTNIRFDLPLHTRRDIALVLQVNKGDINLPDIAQKAPPQILEKLLEEMQNYQRNIQQVEVGLAMLGNDLSAEYYLIPTKGGALEHSLALRQDDRSALEYAGYLPTNMAYCSASGPMLDGMPGAARVVLDLATGIFGMFLPPEQSNGFGKSMEALMAQCSQGRAIGLTAPPVNTPGQPTFVGIYHVSGAQDARAIVHDFLAQVQKVRTSLFGGALTQVFSLEYKPGVETLAATPVDIVTITITSNAPPAKAKAGDGKGTPAAGGMRVDCRLAYVNDKMLFTVGEDGKGQMAAFLDRVKNQKPGFTTSARFQVLKASLPEKVHGFEMFASLDLARAAVNIFAQGNDRTTGLKWLSIFPPQHSPIITYQEMQPDNIRGELRLPAEQMTFFYTLVKAAVEMQQNTAK